MSDLSDEERPEPWYLREPDYAGVFEAFRRAGEEAGRRHAERILAAVLGAAARTKEGNPL